MKNKKNESKKIIIIIMIVALLFLTVKCGGCNWDITDEGVNDTEIDEEQNNNDYEEEQQAVYTCPTGKLQIGFMCGGTCPSGYTCEEVGVGSSETYCMCIDQSGEVHDDWKPEIR